MVAAVLLGFRRLTPPGDGHSVRVNNRLPSNVVHGCNAMHHNLYVVFEARSGAGPAVLHEASNVRELPTGCLTEELAVCVPASTIGSDGLVALLADHETCTHADTKLYASLASLIVNPSAIRAPRMMSRLCKTDSGPMAPPRYWPSRPGLRNEALRADQLCVSAAEARVRWRSFRKVPLATASTEYVKLRLRRRTATPNGGTR